MKYVLIEGIDGTGKSSLANFIFRKALNRGLYPHVCFEPSEGHYGREVRSKIKTGDFKSRDELIDLFMRDREIHLTRTVVPYLESRRMVIQDRGFLSTAAYQSKNDEEVGEIILAHKEKDWFRFPDHLIILTCDPVTACRRISENRGDITALEKPDILGEVQHRYLESLRFFCLAMSIPQITVIDVTDMDLDSVCRRGWSAVSHDTFDR